MKLARWTLLTVLLLLMPGLPAAAQNITVSGKVVDQDQLPIPGVTVMITASQTGTITDLDGNYSIEVPAQAVLEYSCIGYTTQQVEVGGRTLINIVLEESSDVLDEVVFVAYGQQKKESVVAAISAIDATGLRQTPASNLSVALAGRLPGLTVLQRSGVPGGESMEFHIRGMSTINGQEPLTLVDGVERDFSALDPREVETITILKDASATAVYGVRGANGVIIVTTRRGVAGKPVIDVSVEQSWQQPTRLPDMVNAYDLGADDYITKPFSLLVLVSKVHALMRRARQAGEEQKTEIRSGEIRVSYQDMRAYRGGEELSLSKKELQLLLYFMENAGQILSKEQILAHVWDVDGQFVDDNTVPVNVSRLKRKIGGEWIQNVRGMGYLWIQESVKE